MWPRIPEAVALAPSLLFVAILWYAVGRWLRRNVRFEGVIWLIIGPSLLSDQAERSEQLAKTDGIIVFLDARRFVPLNVGL